jgi:glycerol-3-phosphate O-acyltransferase
VRGIELGSELALGAAEAAGAALSALRSTGIVASYAGGIEPVFHVPEERRHAASYYRNSALHCFLGRAIAQLARAAARDASGPEAQHALRLRELLKFEFFFSERDAYLEELERERAILERETDLPFAAGSPRILCDLLESYWVVTGALASLGPGAAETDLLERCHGLGRQLLLQRRIDRPEGLSSIAFANALQLVENRGAAKRTPDGITISDRTALEILADDLERFTALARA